VSLRTLEIWYGVACFCLVLPDGTGNAAAAPPGGEGDSVVFTCRELLGRPTGASIDLNLCAAADVDLYVEYGTQPSVYGSQTPVRSLAGGTPATISLSPLAADTRYYYRVCYRVPGAQDYVAREEHTFHTARPPGRPFVFAIEADPHVDESTNPDLYRRTLVNVLGSHPDFLIDLGDTFMSEKLPVINPQEITSRHLLLRSFFDTLCHSVPLMLAIGNHEGELGWLLNGTPDNAAVWASNIRRAYYPNPVPDGFYSGDTVAESFVGLRQNYHAWEWGNTLFVVLDPYWYTATKPGPNTDNWAWTLGRAQYDWLARTLEKSTAELKFVFAHQVIGGNDTEGRGGIEAVPYYEMGGLNADGTAGFGSHRPGWTAPVHQLMRDHQVSAFFHGHDHVFVRQELDGITYQELPQPGYFNFINPAKSYSNTGLASLYGYTHGVVLPSSGYLRVTVADSGALVEYVRSFLPAHENAQQVNGAVAYSYLLRKSVPASAGASAEPVPGELRLMQNYPNPFNPSTRIAYQLPESGMVSLSVFDVLGREVALLVRKEETAGTHDVEWNASAFSSGVYFCRLAAAGRIITRSMLVVK
jgi:hypothetical protein